MHRYFKRCQLPDVLFAFDRHLVSEGAVRKNDFFFRIQLNRDPANLIALVAVGPEYPQSPPVFCLNLHWNQVSWTVHNSEKVRVSEKCGHLNFLKMAPSGWCNMRISSRHLKWRSTRVTMTWWCRGVEGDLKRHWAPVTSSPYRLGASWSSLTYY